MHLNAKPPVLVPSEHWNELEKMSKAALMDMVWSLAAAASGDADNAPAVLEKIRSEWEVIRRYRKST